MIQNKPKNEYGVVTTGYSMVLEYTKRFYRSGQENVVDVRKEIELKIDPKYDGNSFSDSHTGFFQRITNFQRDANRLMREVKRLLEKGQYVKLSIMASSYEHVAEFEEHTQFGLSKFTLNPLVFNAWEYSGDGMAESDGYEASSEDSKGGLHMCPDTKYTDETHDIWIPWDCDIFKVFAEAGI